MEIAKTKRTINQCCLNGRRALGKTKSEDQDNRLKSKIFIRKMEKLKGFFCLVLVSSRSNSLSVGPNSKMLPSIWPMPGLLAVRFNRWDQNNTSTSFSYESYTKGIYLRSHCLNLIRMHCITFVTSNGWTGESTKQQYQLRNLIRRLISSMRSNWFIHWTNENVFCLSIIRYLYPIRI